MSRPNLQIRSYRAGLLLTERRDGSAVFEALDLDALRRHVGDAILVGFLRLFVWADRLQSMSHLSFWNLQRPEDSVAFSRNLQTLVWMVGGSLFEAADAIEQLDRAGVAARLSNTKEWDQLRQMANRWKTEKRLIRVRNNIGFHVAEKVMLKGVLAASKAGNRLTVLASDDPTAGRTSLRLGLELLLAGTGMTLQQYEEIIKIIADDHRRLSDLVQLVFLGVLRTGGII